MRLFHPFPWFVLAVGVATAFATPVAPRVITSPVKHDTDDPAIWVHPDDPAQSLILGTDKDADGALYVFGLDGRVHWERTVRGLTRPNNVDVGYGMEVGGERIDIAVVTERYAHRLRVFRLPDLAPIDAGGIPVFEGETSRDCMGVALYRRPRDGAMFAIVSRSPFQAPQEGYLAQYRLIDDGTGVVRGVFVRRFGSWSGRKEIEALAVDSDLGYVYASDEVHGIRKYHADPAHPEADEELAVFGTTGFTRDREGISVYRLDARTGYLLVSDQQANRFRVFRREGEPDAPHDHREIAVIALDTNESDGSDVVSVTLPGFPGGVLIAMSDDRTFRLFAWDDLVRASGGILRRAASPPAVR